MPHMDDNRPFYRMAKGIADTLEKKRREFNEGRKQSQVGTLAGLENAIRKRKQEAEDAKRNSY